MTMKTIDLSHHHLSAIVSLYNDCAFELGERPVNRFADRATAEKRTRAIFERRAQRNQERDAEAARRKGLEDATDPGTIKAEHVPGTANHFRLNEAGQAAVRTARAKGPSPAPVAANPAQSRAERKLDQQRAAKKAIATTDAQSGATPAVAAPKERWRRPKTAPAAKVAYLPRPDTQQAVAYDLLTRPEGITAEDFCAAINPHVKQGLPWTPPVCWSWMRWLFVTLRGYGLRFDGQRFWLLRPADERPAASSRTEG